MTAQLILSGPLGEQLVVTVEGGDVLSSLREWGRKGYSSGELPAGGLTLPYGMADTFDWALIGARLWTNPEGEQVVFYRGQSYKRRELAENKKFNMAKCIKFSRGAKSGDLHREGEEGGTQYVTLARFQGERPNIPEWCRQAEGSRSESEKRTPMLSREEATRNLPPEPADETPPLSAEKAGKLQSHLTDKLAGTRWGRMTYPQFASEVLSRPVKALTDLTEQEGRTVARAANQSAEAVA